MAGGGRCEGPVVMPGAQLAPLAVLRVLGVLRCSARHTLLREVEVGWSVWSHSLASSMCVRADVSITYVAFIFV